MKINKILSWVIVVEAVVLFNFGAQFLVGKLNIPLFLDSWATSAGVLFGGVGAGIVGGIIYNLLMAATLWGSNAWIWAISSVWIAIVTFFFYKQGWLTFKNIKKVILAGVLLGFTNALLTFQITLLYFNSIPTYAPTAGLNALIQQLTGSPEVAAFFEHLIIELFDKTITIIIATGIFEYFRSESA